MTTFRAAILLTLLSCLATTAQAATQIKLATFVPKASAWGSQMDDARQEIRQRTDGRVDLKIYYGGVQGHAAKVMQKIKIGQLHGGDFTPTDFQDRLPDLNIYGLPFVFESLDEVDYVRSKMDAELEKEIASAGFVTFGFAGDFAIILSNSPVRGLDDLRGKKVWLPEGDEISDRALKRLQLVPSSKPLSDVMTGLKTGLFDVVAIPPAAAVALQWHTAVNYFTDVPVIYAMQFLAIRNNVFDRLSPGDQAIVSDVLRDVYRELDRQSPQDADNAKEALVNNGIEEIEADSAEFQQIRDVMADNNQVMARQGMFSAEVLKTLQSHLDQYRDGQQAEGDAQAAADSGRQ